MRRLPLEGVVCALAAAWLSAVAYVLGVRIQNAETRGYSLPAVTDIFVAER